MMCACCARSARPDRTSHTSLPEPGTRRRRDLDRTVRRDCGAPARTVYFFIPGYSYPICAKREGLAPNKT